MEGKDVDGYTVGQYLGRGSFGIVYEAEKGGITYAIKFIDMQHIAEAYDDKRRLDREIEALKRVNTDHTVKYEADGYLSVGHIEYKYIVMEFVNGQTLKAILGQETEVWEVNRAIKFITELLTGLDEIHKNNLIHRDLKFDNIAICENGQVKIIDYGLSKVIDFSTLTRSGAQIGAPHFMSPEQILDGRNITYVSDYYAIGVILYYLLTGKLLFESVTDHEITYKTVNVKPPLPSSYNSKIPTNIENAVLRLLAKEPYERFQSVEQIVEAFKVPAVVDIKAGQNIVKFYPRLMTQETTIVERLLSVANLDGVDYPIHAHKDSKKLIAMLKEKGESLDFIADPGTNRMVYTGYRKTVSLRDLPYAPQEYSPYEPEDFDDPEKIIGFVKSVIDLQVASGCTIITAPNFYFDNSNDQWFGINISLLRASKDYLRSNYPGYSLAATVCTKAETLTRKKEKKEITNQFAHNEYDYLLLYIDSIQESTNDAQLYNYIDFALAIKRFTKAKIVAARVPAVGLGLLTVGFDAITSGLGVLDSFEKSIIEKDKDIPSMPTKRYFPDLLMGVNVTKSSAPADDIISFEDQLKVDFPQHTIKLGSTVPRELTEGLSANYAEPKLNFLFSRTNEISEINSAKPSDRKEFFLKRIDKAIDLRKALTRKGVKLSNGGTDGLKTWKEVLAKF